MDGDGAAGERGWGERDGRRMGGDGAGEGRGGKMEGMRGDGACLVHFVNGMPEALLLAPPRHLAWGNQTGPMGQWAR